jgi:hypothetical protein
MPSPPAVAAEVPEVAPADDAEVPSPQLSVRWKAGKLSLEAEGAPLAEVLRAVSGATGIRVTGAQGLTSRVSTQFTNVDLLPALKRLLAGVDHVIVAGPRDSSPDETRVVILGGAAEFEPGPARPDLEADSSNLREEPEAIAQEQEASLEEEPETPHESVVALEDEQEAVLQARLTALQSAANNGDWDSLRRYLQDSDPAVQAAAFEAMAALDKAGAIRDLLAHVKDTRQPTRFQALELLVQGAGADEQTVMSVLTEALQDPDPAFNAYAVQMLAGHDSAAALAALRQALHADPATSLMILESVAHTKSGPALLREALTSSDETVRNTAATLLEQAEGATGTPGRR